MTWRWNLRIWAAIGFIGVLLVGLLANAMLKQRAAVMTCADKIASIENGADDIGRAIARQRKKYVFDRCEGDLRREWKR